MQPAVGPHANVSPTRRVDVVDEYHGTPVADPYRWLEDGDDPEVAEWVDAQNGVTRAALDGDPARTLWHERLVELMQLPIVQSVKRRGDHLFCSERPAGAEQYLLTRRSASDPEQAAVNLFDPSGLSADAATAIDWYMANPDGSVVAIGTSEGGTERSTLRLISGVDGSPVGTAGDVIAETRACSIAWEPDGTGFFYTRYPAGDPYHRTVHLHLLGSDWNDDPVVWAEHPDPQAWPQVDLSSDGRWLLVEVSVGWGRTDVHVLDRRTDTWATVIEGVEANSSLSFAADDRSLVGVTTLDAPKGRLVRIRLDAATFAAGPSGWETLVAERDDVITSAKVTSSGLVLATQQAAVDSLWRLDSDGNFLDDAPVDLGGLVTIDALAAATSDDRWFGVVNSFGSPPSLWRVDGSAATRWAPADAASADLTVTQLTYPSLDGTEIGLFVIHRADVTPTSETATILTGYGGFAISRGPLWHPGIAAWCAAGGLYAIAGLRGGAEHGEAWHEAGMRANKQNVFDDFHAAGEFLVREGLTSAAHLSIYGGSNGGLLMGAAITQRPELFAAVVCAVPLLDMVRFPHFLIARLWTAEYGDPDVADEFEWIYRYSPYHRVVDGIAYPPLLIQTAEGDSRVDPLHARKMAARMQSASTATASPLTVLLMQEERAGHGVGKPVSKVADTMADALVFAGAHTGLTP